SAVIDVGRSKRVITPAQSKALRVRDKGCRFPGCDRQASYTSGHHLVHWIRGGTSDLPNLILLCHRHHWMVHEGNWQLVKTDDGNMLAIPPQLDLYDQLARHSDIASRVRRQ
ncbi:MAG TPA: HNH endonuclease signature motif containing protein, partial [Verrucomicrobiae bacterium]|nr:HNH endonuclease signature motif containing protein [Verrucomicrobiae bacterium]